MPRPKREFHPDHSYHITVRCNNRDFNLASRESREIFLYAIKKAQNKYGFKLYGLCLMLNHVHYLLEPAQPEDIPKIMHWLNWYTAMTFNTPLNRKGHFWEKRYTCDGFPNSDQQRALNTLRYIHANPQAARMRQSYFYDFSNYGTYENLTNDGITQWHPAFMKLGKTLEECANRYKHFCRHYKPKKKKQSQRVWGRKLLGEIKKPRKKPIPLGQLPLIPHSSPYYCQLEDHLLFGQTAVIFIKANRSSRVSS
jgi:putative transposase